MLKYYIDRELICGSYDKIGHPHMMYSMHLAFNELIHCAFGTVILDTCVTEVQLVGRDPWQFRPSLLMKDITAFEGVEASILKTQSTLLLVR